MFIFKFLSILEIQISYFYKNFDIGQKKSIFNYYAAEKFRFSSWQ